jgi:uncharacterized protein
MTRSAWRGSVVAYIRSEAKPEDKYGHQPRLYALAVAVGKGMDYDDDILFAAAWLHDLGVFAGHRPGDPEQLASWDHVTYTISRVCELLAGWGFPDGKINGVVEAIRTHQPQDEPITVEGVILRDADILEQLGAVGALRAFVKVGRDTRYPTFSSVLPVLKRAVDEFPDMLRLNNSKGLAISRIALLRTLLNAIDGEAGDLLY